MSEDDEKGYQEQLLALSAVFQAASLVDKLARTGQVSDAQVGCLLGSLLVRDPKSTLEVYGGDDLNLREGYKALVGALERNPASLQREPLRYALALLGLERQLAKRDDLLQVIGNRLDQIQNQVEHFGLTHDNVVAACGALYQDTISTFRQRIQVSGEPTILQREENAAKVRALLLAGIRSAVLWHQTGGRRWQLRGNFIHDHAKGEGNGVSYAAFLKGNSRDGLIERNLVICESDNRQIMRRQADGSGHSRSQKVTARDSSMGLAKLLVLSVSHATIPLLTIPNIKVSLA
jgi:high frequency lysogenization protein